MNTIATRWYSLLILLCCHPMYLTAGGLSVEGIGTRPLAMGGAFTAVADSPEAVYYNPAGLTQIPGTVLNASVIYLRVINSYKPVIGRTERSWEEVAAPSAFASWEVAALNGLNPIHIGFGIYSPFARVADYGEGTRGGLQDAYGKAVRKDISLTASYQLNEKLSFGGGLIAANGVTEQTVQPGFGVPVTVTDDIDGWGYGGILSLMYQPQKNLRLGIVYRSKIDIDQEGTRKISIAPVAYDIESEIKFPATVGLGIAYMPTDKLTLSAGADWTDWSRLDKVVTKSDGLPDQTTTVGSENTLELRLGAEYQLSPDMVLRAGFLHSPSSTPSEWILPQRPDYEHFYALTIGAGRSWKNMELNLLYEYAWSSKDEVTDNSYGFNGDYYIELQSIGISFNYSF